MSAIDLDRFSQPQAGEPSNGLDSTDPRFVRISDLIHAQRHEDAAEAVAELLDEQIYDIRLVVYYVFQGFKLGGLAILPKVFGALRDISEKSWESFGPSERRELYFDRAVAWICKTLIDTIVYDRDKHTPTWMGWLADTNAAELGEAVAQLESLGAGLATRTANAAAQPLTRLTSLLREAREQLAAPSSDSETLPAVLPTPSGSGASFTFFRRPMEVRGSPKLVELTNKLHAFERLVEHKRFDRAALVSSDVLQLIESFDPREYFPELFGTFGALLSDNVQEISPHWDRKDSVNWQMLDQFYRVDLEGFVGDD